VTKLLFLGVGAVARAVRAALPNVPAAGTTRAAPDLRFAPDPRFTAIVPIAAGDWAAIRSAAERASVVVSFPPDGHSDRAFAELVRAAASVVYLSSTAVYPSTAGLVTEATPVTTHGDRALARLSAEAVWSEVGASVVRLPAFYGPECGLHLSIARGSFRMPGRGTNVVSRVHVDDAARFVCAALSAPSRSLLLAGDDAPAPVADVVSFVCELFDLSMPRASEGEEIPLSLRTSRSVDNRASKQRFDVRLAYPSYREGYRAIRAEHAFVS
jgi:nucleoside-diphosphate-sugar epimerase